MRDDLDDSMQRGDQDIRAKERTGALERVRERLQTNDDKVKSCASEALVRLKARMEQRERERSSLSREAYAYMKERLEGRVPWPRDRKQQLKELALLSDAQLASQREDLSAHFRSKWRELLADIKSWREEYVVPPTEEEMRDIGLLSEFQLEPLRGLLSTLCGLTARDITRMHKAAKPPTIGDGERRGMISDLAWLTDAQISSFRDSLGTYLATPWANLTAEINKVREARAEQEKFERLSGAGDERWPEVKKVVEEFNKKFFVISDVGGHCLVSWEQKEKLGTILRYQSFEDFKKRFQNQLIQVGEKTIGYNGDKVPVESSKGEVWLDHALRRQFDRVVCEPNVEYPPEEGIYNRWKGFAYPPIKGDCSLWYEHIRNNVCKRVDWKYEHYVKRMAWRVQHPGDRWNTALVLLGLKGVGKNMAVDPLVKVFGVHALEVSESYSVIGNFNSHLAAKCVLLANEAVFAGDPRHDRILKHLITGDTLAIEQKGVDVVFVPNLLSLVIMGNDRQLIRASSDERRYFVLEVGDEHREDHAYFGAMQKQLDAGGYSAWLYDMLHMDLGDYDPRSAPKTEELYEQMERSTAEGWDVMKEILISGEIPGFVQSDGTVAVNMSTLLRWTSNQKRSQWSRANSKWFQDVFGARGFNFSRTPRHRELPKEVSGSRSSRAWYLPPLNECRKLWDEKFGPIAWPEDDGKWIGIAEIDGKWVVGGGGLDF